LLDTRESELETAKTKASEWDDYQTAKKDEILKGMTEAQAEQYKSLDLTTLEVLSKDLKINAGGDAPTGRPGADQKGLKYNGYESLPAWAKADAATFRKRKGDYPG